LLLAIVLAQQEPSGFEFTDADSSAVQRFFSHVAQCRAETRTFQYLLGEIADSAPLPTRLGDSLPAIEFGKAYDPTTKAPLFSVDLGDLERLPMSAEIRARLTDSRPPLTRCGVLARTLGEAIAYRRMFQFWRASVMPFQDRVEIAREYGRGREEFVTRDQQRRRDRGTGTTP
jgi:hypothetical protein